MRSLVSRPGGRRRASLLYGVAASLLLLAASPARSQRLLTLVSGVGEAASVGDAGASMGPLIGPVPVAVQVDLDLLRGAPFRLEVPTPDGGVLSAERSVFEDRGGGDLMWSGGQRGSGYDTVVLTVESGRFVGRFAAAAGGAYQIDADRDGIGGMTPVVNERPEGWCGVDSGAGDDHVGHAHGAAWADGEAAAADPPRRVSNPQSHDRLDILVAYTDTAAENWGGREAARAAIRHAGDYLKMVFRNNGLGVAPHIVHIAEAPAALNRARRDLGWHPVAWRSWSLGNWMRNDVELKLLRHEHRADLVHLFTGIHHGLVDGACGAHGLLKKGRTAQDFFDLASGWTTNHPGVCWDYVLTFAHEIGHGLGAHHDPENLIGGLAGQDAIDAERRALFRPYAQGLVNFDVMPSLGTVMSYWGQAAPFFSTPRIRPYGAVMGVEGVQDNERTLRETVHIGVQYSDYLEPLEGLPAPPTDFQVRLDGSVARLSWRDNAPDADGYEVEYDWTSPSFPAIGYDSGFRRLAIEGRTGATLPLENTEPGTRYRFVVQAVKGEVRSPYTRVDLLFPGEPIEPPSDVSVTCESDLNHCEVSWSDNSDNESGFEVELLRRGEPIFRERPSLNAEPERHSLRAYVIFPEVGAEYGVRVFAYNSTGWSAGSETATFRWEHPLAAGPVLDVAATAVGPNTARVTWTADPEVGSYRVIARLRNWRTTLYWASFGRPEDTGWVDFEGLARGGRYTFEVNPRDPSGLPSTAHLVLGERGQGPQAPSDLSWEREEDTRVRVSWKDNSSDELGFEVQTASPGSNSWVRTAIVPGDTESVVSHLFDGSDIRVLAYNERGHSLSSPRLVGPPELYWFTAVAGDMEVGLIWRLGGIEEAVTGVQLRWKATADLPFVGAGDPWVNLPAESRAYTVTGLRNGTEYTFAVRGVAEMGAGPVETATAAPRKGLPSPPAGFCEADAETLCLRKSRFEIKAFWRDGDGGSGPARVVDEGTDDSGLFHFFDPLNWELLVKVLDGCGKNGKMWVLAASTTDLGYWIWVTDTLSAEWLVYSNKPGRPAPAIVDTEAFSQACGGDAGSG